MNIVIVLLIVGLLAILTLTFWDGGRKALWAYLSLILKRRSAKRRLKRNIRIMRNAIRAARKKSTADMGPPTSARINWFGKSLLTVGVIVLLALIALLVWAGWNVLGFMFSVGNWWIGFIVLAAIIVIVDLGFGDKDNAKLSLRDRWKKVRGGFYFALMWAVVVSLGNIILWGVKSQGWQVLWDYNPESHWLFYLVMFMITGSMWLMVNQERDNIKWCGFALLVMALFAWGNVSYDVTIAPMVNSKTVPRPLVIERVTIPKGQIKQFRIDDVEKVVDAAGILNDIQFEYRIDRVGRWLKYPDPRTEHGKDWKFPQGANVFEIKADYDLVALVRRRI